MITPEIASTDRVLCYPSGLNGGQPNELLSYSSVEKRLGTDNPNKTAGVTGLQVEAVSGGKFQMAPLLSPISLVSARYVILIPRARRDGFIFPHFPSSLSPGVNSSNSRKKYHHKKMKERTPALRKMGVPPIPQPCGSVNKAHFSGTGEVLKETPPPYSGKN